MSASEQRAWEILSELNPKDVCIKAKAAFDELSEVYIMKSFLQDTVIAPKDKKIFGNSMVSDVLLKELGNYYRLSVLWYLISAKDIPLSGMLIEPAEMPGGQIYLKGSHVLPLNKIS
ncbi:DUF3786 domain-containing protein, partial [Chloroflexota bacterium]